MKNEWNKIGQFEIERWHMDYETAQINAVSATFGEEKAFGCIVHYIRALIRNLRTKWPLLFREYTAEKPVKGPIRKWVCL